MELGDTDLFELITKSPLRVIPDGIAIDFLIQIFESIDYLHNTHNIVHCDIKPENYIVKFDKNNRKKAILKLIDFGNIRRKPINKERLFNFCGTKEYMAPETLENYGFNEKMDEWAAGVIMFNLLTGVDPFVSDNDSDYKDNIKFKNIKFDFIKNNSLRELNKKLLNRFIDRRITAKEALEEIKKIKDNLKLRNIN
jgi:serine/threonine protein kinase